LTGGPEKGRLFNEKEKGDGGRQVMENAQVPRRTRRKKTNPPDP